MDMMDMAADAEINVAAAFLAPVLHRESIVKAKEKSIVSILDPSKENDQDRESGARGRVISKALALLLNIHHALCQVPIASSSSDVLRNLKSHQTIDALLDLISLEGIYPCLSPGVGIPIERRVRSVLNGGIVTRTSSIGNGEEAKDKELLANIIKNLDEIASSKAVGLKSTLQQRTMVDLIAGLGELAYNPSCADEKSRSSYAEALKDLLDAVPAPTLFPILSSLIQPATPRWFRVHLSTYLSLLPLRPKGVQQTISFIASTAPQAQHSKQEQRSSHNDYSPGLTFSLDVLNQASRLLVAVPSSLTADVYFSSIGPQLLQLLDSQEVRMKRAAAYIIGNGILGRRKYGSPGSVGWDTFVYPILEALNPKGTRTGVSKKKENVDRNCLGTVVVSEASLRQAFDRLSSLLLLHPNPGLTKRLMTPLLLSLWGLWCYSKETRRSRWTDEIYELFCVYFKTAAGVEQFICLVDRLRWSGTTSSSYGPGPNGGIEIRERLEDSNKNLNIVVTVQNIDGRVDELMRLLGAQVLGSEGISTVFLHASKNWLLGNQSRIGRNSLRTNDESIEDPFLLLIYAKTTQKILENYKDKLSANPNKIIEFVGQLLAAFIAEHKDTELKTSKASKPSIAGLSSILNPETKRSLEGEDHGGATEEEPTEIVSIALNLLSAILPSSDISRTATVVDLIAIRRSLSYLAASHALPTSLILAASKTLALLDIQKPFSSSIRDKVPGPLDYHEADLKSHSLALIYLVDPLPPVRAQGLSLLTELVKHFSPVLDIPSSTILLISLLQDEDEFIYLSAIQALGMVASKHPRTVVKLLIEDYIDPLENKELDVRIRVGEALLKTVENLGESFIGEPARLVGEGMIAVAGRRGRRAKQGEAKARKSLQERNASKEAEEAWGGEVPQVGDETKDETSQRLAKVVEGWEGHQGEEDVRIRASALSILGVAIETNVAGVGPAVVSTAMDLVVAILKFEITSEKAILRRAAVLVIMSLVKALDAADERGRILSFGFAGENLAEVISVLRYLEATEKDDLVIGHARVVIESFETWQSKSILDVPRSMVDFNPRTQLNGGQLAGLSVFPDASTVSRPKIEEIE